MKNTVHIRSIRTADINRVADLEKEIFPAPWSEDSIRSFLMKNPASRGIVAELNGVIVGYAFFWIATERLHIANIAVDKEYRRRKYGEKLLQSMIDTGCSSGVEYALLEVRESNLPAVLLYKKWGFQQIGVRKNYYSDNKEHGLIMCKIL